MNNDIPQPPTGPATVEDSTAADPVPQNSVPERYGDSVFNHTADHERQRLEALGDALDPNSFATLSALPLPGPDGEGLRLLELAAGTGSVARWLAARFPRARVVGTDLDLLLLNDPQHPNLEFVRHDVTRDQFSEGDFHLIHARYLLSHLPSRDRVLADLVRWLAPGGWLVLEDAAMFPLSAARDSVFGAVSRGVFTVLRERIGTDCVDWPLDMADKAAGLGLTDVSVRVTCPTMAHDSGINRFWVLTLSHLKEAITALPGIGPGDVDTVIERLSRPGLLDLGLATVTMTAAKPAR